MDNSTYSEVIEGVSIVDKSVDNLPCDLGFCVALRSKILLPCATGFYLRFEILLALAILDSTYDFVRELVRLRNWLGESLVVYLICRLLRECEAC